MGAGRARISMASVAAFFLAAITPPVARSYQFIPEPHPVSAVSASNLRRRVSSRVRTPLDIVQAPALHVRPLRKPPVLVAVAADVPRAPPSSRSAWDTPPVAEGHEMPRAFIAFAVGMFCVGAALAAAETAITTLWPWKVRELAEKEGPSSPFAVLNDDLTRFLTTILVTTTASTVFATAIATEFAGEFLGASGVAYFTAGITVFFLFFGEILPKALAVHSPAKVARVMVPVIGALSKIVFPLGKLLAACSTQILILLKLPIEGDSNVSEEELRLIVAGADRSGSIEKYESTIIKNVLDLEEKDVREVMIPRVDMVALPATGSLADLLVLESDAHYSRMPVYDGSIDNIIGIVYAKSLLRYLTQPSELLDNTQVAEIMDPAFFVPESMSVWVVLEEMRKRRLHMAIVVDEYGGTAGLVTLEDILEEVVGEIYDEDDDYEAETQYIDREADGRFRMEGQADLEKVAETLGLVLCEDDLREYGTISGLLCAKMGGIPEVGDEFVLSRMKFTVAEADDRRIVTLIATAIAENSDSNDLKDGVLDSYSNNSTSDVVNPPSTLQKLIASIGPGTTIAEKHHPGNDEDPRGEMEATRGAKNGT